MPQLLFYGFMLHQMGLITKNLTTNETFKLKDLKHAAAAYSKKLKLPANSPYFVSYSQSLSEVFRAPVRCTRERPYDVWETQDQSIHAASTKATGEADEDRETSDGNQVRNRKPKSKKKNK